MVHICIHSEMRISMRKYVQRKIKYIEGIGLQGSSTWGHWGAVGASHPGCDLATGGAGPLWP